MDLIINTFLILPSIVSCLALWATNDALISTTLFHVSIYYLPKFWLNRSKATMIRREELFEKPTLQIFVGFMLGVISAISVLIFYDVTSQLWPEDYSQIRLPFRANNLYFAALGVDFVLINPLLEEIYWNVFIVHLGRENCNPKRHSLVHLFKVSLFFGIYHFFAVCYIFSFRAGIVISGVMTLIGAFFLAIRLEFGLLASMLTHIGGDLGVGLVFVDIMFQSILYPNPLLHRLGDTFLPQSF